MALSKINTMNHSHWITAVIGLHYLEEGLQYFCDDVVKELHATIMARCPENCTECKLETLQPNHICEDKRCPLGYQNCNCRKTNVALIPCPKRICGFIYDEIIKLYASTPPAPNWKNTDINQWCTNPWAVATCFIPITGYLDRKCGAEVDCAGLLLLIMKNQAFLKHLDCKIDGKDAFSQAVQIRNGLFHSSSLELMREEAHRYIDDMIKVLQDQSELVKRHESKKAVKKLIELKEGDIPSELDMDKLNNLIETDEQGLIQYLRDKLNSLWSETLNQNFRIQDPGFTQRRKLDTSVAEQEDKGKLFEYFLKVKSVLFEVEAIDSIDEHTEKSIAKYSEDQTQALRIHVVQVEILDLEIKKLKQADDRKVDDAVEYAPSTSCVLESSARKDDAGEFAPTPVCLPQSVYTKNPSGDSFILVSKTSAEKGEEIKNRASQIKEELEKMKMLMLLLKIYFAGMKDEITSMDYKDPFRRRVSDYMGKNVEQIIDRKMMYRQLQEKQLLESVAKITTYRLLQAKLLQAKLLSDYVAKRTTSQLREKLLFELLQQQPVVG